FGLGASYVTFDLSQSAAVNVLYDERATQLPAWLDSFTATGENFSGYDVYSRLYPPGRVALGGNANPPMAGAQSMYGVAVVAASAAPVCGPLPMTPAATGATVTFRGSVVSGTPPFTYSWDFGDGSPPTAPSASPVATHAFASSARYTVVLRVQNAAGTTSCAAVQIVHDPVTAVAPTASTTLLYETGRVYCVNADQDTVSAFGAATMRKLWELPTGAHPRTLALASREELWVLNQDDATITVIGTLFGVVERTIALPRGVRPYGLAFRPDGGAVFVSLEAPGGVLKLDRTGAVVARRHLDGAARGLAVSHDGTRVLVTRFRSSAPATTGTVWELDTETLRPARSRYALHYDPGPDTESSGRGVPNYLTSVRISPSGTSALVPSKKDNTARGLFRSGEPLTFESRVRTIVSRLDLVAGAEAAAARVDLNDRDMAQAVAFSPLGDLYYVACQGSNVVDVFDTASNALVATLPVGFAPQGLAIDTARERLLVHSFMSRSIQAFDLAEMLSGVSYVAPLAYDVDTTSGEALSSTVLLGKQIFYNADDPRMSLDGYLSCASCHLDGDHDGQVWDFTQGGEGLRNTISLLGRSGLGHGRLHWTANFDEVQDFEHDMRDSFGGRGFLTAAQLAAAPTPLGPPKAGMSPELDALAAYVSSLRTMPVSPFAAEVVGEGRPGAAGGDGAAGAAGGLGGSVGSALVATGRALFARLQCASCHVPPSYTDGLRHDVGTIQPSSGLGLGQPLPGVGIETPTLLGLWGSAPYFHNGQAASLDEVLRHPWHGGAATQALTRAQRQALADYLRGLR
ncbi:MAG: PKD domain-containing protein, partial [Planctomycetota bacterium]